MAKAGSEGKDIGRNKERAANASSRLAACAHLIKSGKMVVSRALARRNLGEKEC
jgi:hypothetical protein